jgi:hypothetical protein
VSKTIRPIGKEPTEEFWAYESGAPTHFFGELTKTPEGCQYLQEKGVVPELAEMIRMHGMEDSDQELITSAKAALWAMVSSEASHPVADSRETSARPRAVSRSLKTRRLSTSSSRLLSSRLCSP